MTKRLPEFQERLLARNANDIVWVVSEKGCDTLHLKLGEWEVAVRKVGGEWPENPTVHRGRNGHDDHE